LLVNKNNLVFLQRTKSPRIVEEYGGTAMKTWTNAWLSVLTVGALLGAAALSAPAALAATGSGPGPSTPSTSTAPASLPAGAGSGSQNQASLPGNGNAPNQGIPPVTGKQSSQGAGSQNKGNSFNDNSGSSKSGQSKTGAQGNPTQDPGGIKPLDAPEVPYAAIFPFMAVLAFGIYRWRARKSQAE
jgi:hypothetical protein